MSNTTASNRSKSYNRGEWAELYVLAKLLCERKVSVRVHGSAEKGKDLHVLQVRRGIGEDTEEFQVEVDRVLCCHSKSQVAQDKLCKLIKPLLTGIKNGRGSFALAHGDELLNLLGISQLKRDSREKSDLYLNVEDPISGVTGWQGYTVKALLGSKPTLFNASEPTNFLFRIDPPLTIELINHYNATGPRGKPIHGPRDMVSDLISKGYEFELVEVDERFRENLELLDSDMPSYLSEALVAYYGKKGKTVSAIAEVLGELNPLGVRNPDVRYSHKIKDFLEASAYGMVPTEPYGGERTASGGLLLVERNGDLVCFRLDDKDRSRDYLIEHTYFDTASRGRHRFGVLEDREGETHLKLNLQIRYK